MTADLTFSAPLAVPTRGPGFQPPLGMSTPLRTLDDQKADVIGWGISAPAVLRLPSEWTSRTVVGPGMYAQERRGFDARWMLNEGALAFTILQMQSRRRW